MSKNTILHYPETNSIIKNDTLLFDTTFFVEAVQDNSLLDLLEAWYKKDCELLTLPGVVQEFTRGMCENLEQYINALSFIESAGVTVTDFHRVSNPVRDKQDPIFTFFYATHSKKASQVDYALCLEAMHYPQIKLISGNSRDIPEKIFDRIDVIAVDRGSSIHGEYIYQFNPDNFAKATAHLLPRF